MAAKKGKRALKSQFSFALSAETGCLVMVRTYGDKVTVIGSIDRQSTLKFAGECLAWAPEASKAQPERAVYPH